MKQQTKAIWHDFKCQSFEIIQRMLFRTFVLVLLTAVGLTAVDALVESGMTDRFSLVRRFPEFIPMVMAAAKFTFIEVSLMWITIATQSVLAKQRRKEMHNVDAPIMVPVTHVCDMLKWMFRVCVFIYLMG